MGRVLTFADPAVIKMAQERFISVAADDWYQRRRKDAEGEFFLLVSNQSPRKSAGSSTRQGIYFFTASGKLLAFRNHPDPDVMKSVFKQALAAWDKLPAREREPGAVKVPELGKVDLAYARRLPKGAAVVNVYTRILDKNAKGEYCHGTCEFTGGDRASHDRLWLTAEEIKRLVPKDAKPGTLIKAPDAVVRRIARFHLVDNTRGEPPHWSNKDIRNADLTLEVTSVKDGRIELKMTGEFLLATNAEVSKAERGYDLRVLGYVTVSSKLERFEAVALGEHWGRGPFTGGARPGRTPLGIAFELSSGTTASDQVPPQGGRWLQGYLEAEKH